MAGTDRCMMPAFGANLASIWVSTASPQKAIFENRGPESPLAFTPQVDPKQEVILV